MYIYIAMFTLGFYPDSINSESSSNPLIANPKSLGPEGVQISEMINEMRLVS